MLFKSIKLFIESQGGLRNARKAAGMSQSELEKATGIKREYISKMESNELKNPTYKTLLRLCKGLGISLIELEGGMKATVRKTRG